MHLQIVRSLVLTLAITFVAPLLALPQNTARLVLTNTFNGLENTPHFSCSDTIHGYLTLPEKAVGSHLLEGIWTMPNGQQREHSTNKVEFAPPGRQTAYVWLMFQDNSDGFLGSVRSQQPASDNAANAYDGEWKLNVLWDGQPLVESTFHVKC